MRAGYNNFQFAKLPVNLDEGKVANLLSILVGSHERLCRLQK